MADDSPAGQAPGGQSGGDSGNSVGPQVPCACLDGTRPTLRARVRELQDLCAEIEVLEVLSSAYPEVEVGDSVAGSLRPLCAGPEISIAETDEVRWS